MAVLPILVPDGSQILRGLFIRIPERADTNWVTLTPDQGNHFAQELGGFATREFRMLEGVHRENAVRPVADS